MDISAQRDERDGRERRDSKFRARSSGNPWTLLHRTSLARPAILARRARPAGIDQSSVLNSLLAYDSFTTAFALPSI